MASAAACRAPVALANAYWVGRPKPTRRWPALQRTAHRQSQLNCQAAASTAEQGVTAWLSGAGVDTGKQAVVPSGSGLVTSRPVNKGEQLFAIPESAWITPQTAAQSEIGQYLTGWVPHHIGRAGSTWGTTCWPCLLLVRYARPIIVLQLRLALLPVYGLLAAICAALLYDHTTKPRGSCWCSRPFLSSHPPCLLAAPESRCSSTRSRGRLIAPLLPCACSVDVGRALSTRDGDAASQSAQSAAGPAGSHLAPASQACRLEPWLAIALFLLHERAKGAASRWAGYVAALPADSGSPVQWGEEELAELAGSQLLGTVQGYRWVLRQPAPATLQYASLSPPCCPQLAGLCSGRIPGAAARRCTSHAALAQHSGRARQRACASACHSEAQVHAGAALLVREHPAGAPSHAGLTSSSATSGCRLSCLRPTARPLTPPVRLLAAAPAIRPPRPGLLHAWPHVFSWDSCGCSCAGPGVPRLCSGPSARLPTPYFRRNRLCAALRRMRP